MPAPDTFWRRFNRLTVPAGRSRPLRGLRRSRQERHSKDTAKLLLLYDENILDNDPHRESKDVAFAQSYLNRVSPPHCSPEPLSEFGPIRSGLFVFLLPFIGGFFSNFDPNIPVRECVNQSVSLLFTHTLTEFTTSPDA